MYNMNKEMIDCITIKVESVVRDGDYNKRNNTFNEGYSYTVRLEDAAKAMVFIANLFKYCKLPCARIYPVKFECTTNDYIWTEQKMIDQVVDEALKLGTITLENVNKLKNKHQ